MKITETKLPQSRLKFDVLITNEEIQQYFDQAIDQLSPAVKISGFRSGKAPIELIKQQLDSEVVRGKASSLAVRAAWEEITNQLSAISSQPSASSKKPTADSRSSTQSKLEQSGKLPIVIPISDPEVTLEKFVENSDGKISFEFDIRPQVTVGAYQKIKIKPSQDSEATDTDVGKLINSLRQAHASSVIKLEPAKIGDRMELNFEGSIGGIRQDKLSAKNFPVVVGEGTTIPGFDAELVGLKKNETKTFKLKFPADHFDKKLAGQEAEFKVMVNEVFQVILPELDDEFAAKFDHKNTEQLRAAIKADIARQRGEDMFVTQKAQWLAEFEKLVAVDIPQSLINVEVERSRQAWRQFLQERHLNEADWLTSRELTIDKLEKDWQTAAKSSVTIGLGLAEVAKDLKKDLKDNDAFQKLLDDLVRQAIAAK